MAKKETRLTKSGLLKEMEEKLQDLNLLYSALKAEQGRKQEDLENYRDRFYALVGRK